MRVVLMRHAHAAAAPGKADRDRPLSARGEQDADTMGRWLGTHGGASTVICSSARRARQTWEIVAGQWAQPPEASYSDELYRAGCNDLLDLIADNVEDEEGLLIVGHNPTISQTADVLLDEPGPDFPPGACAILDYSAEQTRLIDFAAP